MTVTATILRTDFPEFTDPTAYPDSQVNFWIMVAGLMMNPVRWSDRVPTGITPPRSLRDVGTELFVCHNLVLDRQAQRAATRGAVPGASFGIVTSEAAGGVSVSYDPNIGLDPADGMWNLSTYGLRFAYLLKLAGMGPIQVGGRIGGPRNSGGAWIGPGGGWRIGESW